MPRLRPDLFTSSSRQLTLATGMYLAEDIHLGVNYMKKIILIAISFLFTACTTVEFVRRDTNPVKKAVLRHSPPSSTEKAEKYKEEVAKKAHEFCGGDFDITKEYQAREETGTSTGLGTGVGVGMGGIMIGGATRNTAMYNFVEFSCRP